MSLTKVVKTTVLTLGIGATLVVTQAGQAQNVISLKLIGGGSSALQGDYRTASFAPGAIPLAIQTIAQIGTGAAQYKNAVQPEHLIAVRSADPSGDSNAAGRRYVLSGGDGITTVNVSPNDLVAQINPGATGAAARYEVINDALIRYTPTNGNNFHDGSGNTKVNVIVLLRTDSGQGVRYVANRMKLVQFPAIVSSTYNHVLPDPPSVPATGVAYTFAPISDPDDINVVNFLAAQTTAGNVNISTGFSDVTADTVYRYAGFTGLNNPPSAFTKTPLAVLTLLPLYNNSIHSSADFVVNITQHLAQNITAGFAGPTVNPSPAPNPIQWKNVDSRLPAVQIKSAYRENASGTRMTYLVDVLRFTLAPGSFLSENVAANTLQPTNPNPQLGTGTMVGTIASNANAYGYSFITGGAGNNRPTIRVAAYNGVLASSPDITGASSPLPTSAAYLALGSIGQPYYPETINGRYPLWSVANAFNVSTGQGANESNIISSIVSAFAADKSVPYSQGLVLVGDLNTAGTFRDQFTSPVTGEDVTDGMEINFDPTGNSIPSPVVQ